MRRGDPVTYAGPFTEEQTEGSRKGFHGLYENCRSGYIWKDRQAGATEELLDLVPRTLMPIAEQLLGKDQVLPASGEDMGQFFAPDELSVENLQRWGAESDVGVRALFSRYLHCVATGRQGGDPLDGLAPGPPFNERFTGPAKEHCGEDVASMMISGTRARGIYTTLPHAPSEPWARREAGTIEETGRSGAAATGGHVDSLVSHLGVIAFVDDVHPNGGGTQLWPGSHRRVYHHFHRQHSYTPAGPGLPAPPGSSGLLPGSNVPADFGAQMQAIREDTAAVDTFGPAGTVILMHHRLCHCPGQNRSGLNLRQAVLYDYIKTNVDDGPPHEDMWHDWSEELRQAGRNEGESFHRSPRAGEYGARL